MAQDKQPVEILNETSFILIDDSMSNYVVDFYNNNDELLRTILITPLQVGILVEYIIQRHGDISIYQPDLSNLIVPSNKQLYEALNIKQ